MTTICFSSCQKVEVVEVEEKKAFYEKEYTLFSPTRIPTYVIDTEASDVLITRVHRNTSQYYGLVYVLKRISDGEFFAGQDYRNDISVITGGQVALDFQKTMVHLFLNPQYDITVAKDDTYLAFYKYCGQTDHLTFYLNF